MEEMQPLPRRIIELLNAAQPKRDRSGLLSVNAIRGIFVNKGKIISMNGRMLVEVGMTHMMLPAGQYHINKLTVIKSQHNGFFPTKFSGTGTNYTHRMRLEGPAWPGVFSTFCNAVKFNADLGDCSKVLDVLARSFSDCVTSFYCCERDVAAPLLMTVINNDFIIYIYCYPYPANAGYNLVIEEVSDVVM